MRARTVAPFLRCQRRSSSSMSKFKATFLPRPARAAERSGGRPTAIRRVSATGSIAARGDTYCRWPVKCRAVGVERRPVHGLVACAARPGGVSAAVTEAGLMTHQHLSGPRGWPLGIASAGGNESHLFPLSVTIFSSSSPSTPTSLDRPATRAAPSDAGGRDPLGSIVPAESPEGD